MTGSRPYPITMLELAAIVARLPVKGNPWMPPGTVYRVGDEIFAHSDLLARFHARYVVVQTSPPCLLDKTNGQLVSVPSLEDAALMMAAHRRFMDRPLFGMDV